MKVDSVKMLNASKGANVVPSVSAGSVQKGENKQEISKEASDGISSLGKSQVNKGNNASLVLSFKGGNPKQVVHIVPEGLFYQGGGVGTVIGDWIKKFPEFDKDAEHIFVMPYYNASLVRDNEGKVIDVNTLVESAAPVFKDQKGRTHKVKKLMTYTIKSNNMDTKQSEDIVCKMFDASDALSEDVFKEMVPNSGKKPKLLLVQTPKISSMGKPYGNARVGYAGGHMFEHYAECTKAGIEGMSQLRNVEGFEDFDPRNIVVHDWHSSSALAYIKQKANEGDPLFKDLNLGYIFHNAGRGGYQGAEAGPLAVFKAFATPEEFETVVKSQKYMDLFTRHGETAYREQKQFWKDLMPGLADELDTINPSMLPISLGENGYVKLATVSPGYAKECAVNPEFAMGLTEHMKTLEQKGTLQGITNGLAAPDRASQISSSASPLYHDSTFRRLKKPIKYQDGTELRPMLTFDPEKLDIDDIASVKKANKLNFLERIVKYKDVDPETLPKGVEPINLVTGLAGKKATITSTLDESTLKAVKNDDAKLFVSWGRGDFQKGIDELLMGIKKYVKGSSDDGKSIFVVCGGLQDNEEGKRIKQIIEELADKTPELKGRFAYIDGWGPASVMGSSGDFGVFASRFEPCGLTPQETYARGGAVIGTHTGGMKSTVIDFNGENIDTATGFRTKKGFYDIDPMNMSREELEKTAAGKKYLEAYDKAIKQAQEEFEVPFVTKAVEKNAKNSELVGNAVRNYRDEVMAQELAEQISRAAYTPSDQVKRIHLNAASLNADWDNNAAINNGTDTAFDSYKKHFFNGFTSAETAQAPTEGVINKKFIESLADNTRTVADNVTENVSDRIEEVEEIGEKGLRSLIKRVQEVPFMGKVAGVAGLAVVAMGGLYALEKAKSKKAAKAEAEAKEKEQEKHEVKPQEQKPSINPVQQRTNTSEESVWKVIQQK